MKNKFKGILLIITLFLSIFMFSKINSANIEDMPNRIFRGEFESFFIGTIIEEDNKSFIIEINKTFMGKELEKIQVNRFNEYTFSNLKPQKNDIIVAILNYDKQININWVFKSTSTDYEILYLADDKDPDNKDLILFQNLINTGQYIEDKEQIKKIEEDKEKKEEKKTEISTNTSLTTKKAPPLSDFSEMDKKLDIIFKFLKSPVKVFFIGLMFLAIAYVTISSKKYRDEVEKEDFYGEDDSR